MYAYNTCSYNKNHREASLDTRQADKICEVGQNHHFKYKEELENFEKCKKSADGKVKTRFQRQMSLEVND